MTETVHPKVTGSTIRTYHQSAHRRDSYDKVRSQPEVDYFSDSAGLVNGAVDSHCLRLVQSIPTVEHNRNRSGKTLPICCRHGGKRSESTSPTSNSRNTPKNTFDAADTAPEHPLYF